MAKRDYYEVLGVERGASEAELKLLSIRANVGAEIDELMVNT